MKKIRFTLSSRSAAALLLFAVIFGLAFWLRQFTFWLPHWQGDQSQYVILAMKLGAKMDPAAYNLSETNVEYLRTDAPPGTTVAYPYRAPGVRGEILDSYHRNSIGYYDMPLFYKAPLFPIILNLSHRLFAGPDSPYAVLQSNLAAKVLELKPRLYLNTQFWAAVVPFASSLMILTLCFLWTWHYFGVRAALYAAFILAIHPVSILTSNRLWTEDVMTLFLALGLWTYYEGFTRRKLWACFAGGVLTGLSVLTNQKSLLPAFGMFLFTLIAVRSEGEGKKSLWRGLWDLRWWAFAFALALVTAKWFWTIWSLYGNPLWEPKSEKINPSEWGWYRVLLSRPHGVIFYPVGTVAIAWAFAAGFATLRDGVRSGIASWRGKALTREQLLTLFAWCWTLPLAAYLMNKRTGEYRYLFPAYPVIAAMSGWMLVRLEKKLAGILARPWFATVVIAIFLIGSACYAIPVTFKTLWLERNLIHAPWR
jgi:hypothetical protein